MGGSDLVHQRLAAPQRGHVARHLLDPSHARIWRRALAKYRVGAGIRLRRLRGARHVHGPPHFEHVSVPVVWHPRMNDRARGVLVLEPTLGLSVDAAGVVGGADAAWRGVRAPVAHGRGAIDARAARAMPELPPVALARPLVVRGDERA